MAIKKGSKVRQVMPAPFEGLVESYAVDQQTGETQLKVTRIVKDADGTEHEQSMYLQADGVELIEGPVAETTPAPAA